MEILERAPRSAAARAALLAVPASPLRVSVPLALAAPEVLRRSKLPRVPARTSPWKSADLVAQTASSARRPPQHVALPVRPVGRTRPPGGSPECAPATHPLSHTGKLRSRFVPA